MMNVAMQEGRTASAGAPREDYACACGQTVTTGRRVVAKDPFTGELFAYVTCVACGLDRLEARPILARIGDYYPPTYGCYAPAAPRAPGLTDRLKDLIYRTFYDPAGKADPAMRVLLWPLRWRSVMAFRQPAVRRVFEIGAGRGADLLTFKAAGWEALGCEPSPEACQVAAMQGLALQNCLAEEAQIPSGTGCVFMNNVFEHLYDPAFILAKARAALADDGVLVLIVPNHGSWTARLFGASWPGYDSPRHIWGWTPRSVRMVLERAGFSIDYVNQQAPISLWSNTLEGINAPAPHGALRRWLMGKRWAARALVPLGWLAAACGHGDYIRVVARKA